MYQDKKVRMATMTDISNISKVLAASWKVAYRGLIDHAYLDTLQADHWIPFLTEGLETHTITCLVVCSGNMIVGAAAIRKSKIINFPNDGELVCFYLHPHYLNHGFGQFLYEAVEKELEKQEFEHCVLDVLLTNYNAIQFYKKQGYVATTHTIKSKLGTQTVICNAMRKSLKQRRD